MYTTVPLKLQMDKNFIHTNSNELKMREGFPPFFNCCLMFHFKSVYFKSRCNTLEFNKLQ